MIQDYFKEASEIHPSWTHVQHRGENYATLIKNIRKAERYAIDITGIIAYVYPDGTPITGYDSRELIGKNFTSLFADEETIPFSSDEWMLHPNDNPISTRFLLRKNKVVFWAKIKHRAVYDGDRLIGFRISIVDATHSFLSSFRLRNLKRAYTGLFDNQFVGIIRISLRDHSFLRINGTARKMIHAHHNRLDEIFAHADDFTRVIQALEKDHKTEFELQIRERKKWLMISLRHTPGTNYADGVMVDITDVKKKDGKLIRLTHELDQFIYHTSHELRAPLASILGITNLMRMEKDPHIIHSYTSMLENRVHALDGLLRKMVTLIHRKKKTNDSIDWESLTIAMIQDCWSPQSPVRITYDVQQQDDFWSDATGIRIIFYHLISNALQYFNPECPEPKLTIRIRSAGHDAIIQFMDNGIGIDPELLPSIFDIFFKAHTHSPGHGLGLYITKTMIDNLDGSIDALSEPDTGTTFSIIIPNRLRRTML